MPSKKQNVMNLMAQIQNLSAEEQAMFTNMASRLAANATDEQKFTNVTKAMQAAGWNPIKRAYAGVSTAARNKMETTKGINSRLSARTARFFGMTGTAEFIDRWLTSAKPMKLKAAKEKKEKVEKDVSKDRTSTARADTGSSRNTGTILGIKKQLNYVSITVDNISDDITDIKALLMPRKIVVRGKRYTGEWGENRDEDRGKVEFAQYNPLAPEGSKFLKLKKKMIRNSEGRNLYTMGGPSSTPINKGFEEDAMKKAAMATAILALKIEKKDKAKAELRNKYSYKGDAEENYENDSPLERIDKRLSNIEKILGDGTKKEKKNGWLGMIVGLLGGLWLKVKGFLSPIWSIVKFTWNLAKPILSAVWSVMKKAWTVIRAVGQGLARLLGRWFPNLTIPGLTTVAAAGAAAAVVAGEAYVLDKSMKQTADKSIDKITADVTTNQKREGFKPEESYEAYKQSIDTALSSPMNTTQERQDYIRQQLTSSEGLSDLERRMAARYFAEKDGNVGGSSGPKTRGGARGSSTAIPAEVLTDSDTYDTNYTPAPKPTGSLRVNDPNSTQSLLAQIAKGEGTSDEAARAKGLASGYDVTLGYGAYNKPTDKPLSKMTLDEVYKLQTEILRNPNNKLDSSAVGKYQIVRKTLFGEDGKSGLFAALNLKRTDIFSPELQDRLGEKLLEWRGLNKLRNGKMSSVEFQAGLAKEWASIADPTTGKSAYGQHVGTNTADIRPLIASLGSRVDQESRTLMESNSPLSAVTVVGGTTVNQTSISQTGPKRKIDRADVLSNDNALVRNVMRDSVHPVNVG